MPATDTPEQSRRPADKFIGLVEASLGLRRSQALVTMLEGLETQPDIAGLATLCAGR